MSCNPKIPEENKIKVYKYYQTIDNIIVFVRLDAVHLQPN